MVSMSDVVTGGERWHIQHADCLFALLCLPDACIDSIVTDPPYGLGPKEPTAEEIIRYLQGEELDTGGDFMGKKWRVPSVPVWRECLRVLKPGGHVLAFGGTRTFDLISLGLRAAGFQFRDTISAEGVLRWYHGQGFPKSLNVSKEIDEAAGAVRSVIGPGVRHASRAFGAGAGDPQFGTFAVGVPAVTAPATDAAKTWDGWGTALKPSWEPILVFRKPLDGTVVETVLTHGTGALNIDACRVFTDWNEADRSESWRRSGHSSKPDAEKIAAPPGDGIDLHPSGRWPPNALFTHLPGCAREGTKRVRTGVITKEYERANRDGYSGPMPCAGSVVHYGDADGLETVEAWKCAHGCPIAALDLQSGKLETHAGSIQQQHAAIGFGGGPGSTREVISDSGGASRFFHQFQPDPALDVGFHYTAKASRAERDAGLDGERNPHVSVKPVAEMRYLVRLVTPPGGLVLDPYVGSGSTGVAAMLEEGGVRFLGIERELIDVENATARIRYVVGGLWRTPEETAGEAVALDQKKQLALF